MLNDWYCSNDARRSTGAFLPSCSRFVLIVQSKWLTAVAPDILCLLRAFITAPAAASLHLVPLGITLI